MTTCQCCCFPIPNNTERSSDINNASTFSWDATHSWRPAASAKPSSSLLRRPRRYGRAAVIVIMLVWSLCRGNHAIVSRQLDGRRGARSVECDKRESVALFGGGTWGLFTFLCRGRSGWCCLGTDRRFLASATWFRAGSTLFAMPSWLFAVLFFHTIAYFDCQKVNGAPYLSPYNGNYEEVGEQFSSSINYTSTVFTAICRGQIWSAD